MKMKRIYASVYGCPSNIVDYEIALGLLKQAEFEIVNSPEKADLNLIFTCIVKNPSSQRMIHIIKKLTALNKPLIVAGCMPKIEQRLIEKINPSASLLGPDSISHIVDAAHAAFENKKTIFVSDERRPKLGFTRIRKKKNVGVVSISIGCLSDCSYCATKFARGKLKSYATEKIVEEVENFVKEECKEIWLTSEDNSCYGLDIGTNLAALLKKVCAIKGDFRIRVGMMNPTYIKDEKLLKELIEVYKDKKVQKFLHLPAQSGSDKTLRAMKRGYTVADFEKIVGRFRKEVPEIYISTDIIVGFPDEDDKDFEATVELLRKIKPDKVNISKFGARPGTEATKMKQLPVETINERSRRLHTLLKTWV